MNNEQKDFLISLSTWPYYSYYLFSVICHFSVQKLTTSSINIVFIFYLNKARRREKVKLLESQIILLSFILFLITQEYQCIVAMGNSHWYAFIWRCRRMMVTGAHLLSMLVHFSEIFPKIRISDARKSVWSVFFKSF